MTTKQVTSPPLFPAPAPAYYFYFPSQARGMEMKLAEAAKRIKAYPSLLANSYVLSNWSQNSNVEAGRDEFNHFYGS